MAAVRAAVDAARQDFGACRYDALARSLPARIALAQALDADGQIEQLWRSTVLRPVSQWSRLVRGGASFRWSSYGAPVGWASCAWRNAWRL